MVGQFDEEYLKEIRKNFPYIEKDFKGTSRIFVDNGAGSLVLRRAAEAEYNARMQYSANTDAIYNESKMNEEVLSEGRKSVSCLLNASNPNSIYEGESASALLFKLSYALRNYIGIDDNVVTTSAEHFANVAPYLEMKKNNRISELRIAGLSKEDGSIDMDNLSSLIDSRTKVIAITAESNLLGNKTEMGEVSKIAHENNAMLVVDGVHYTPQSYFDVNSVDCDFFVFSAYKIFGPRGSFAYLSDRALDIIDPFFVDREAKAGKSSYFELGTKDQAIFAAISAIVQYIGRLSLDMENFKKGTAPNNEKASVKAGMMKIEKYQDELTRAVLEGVDGDEGLYHIKNVKLYGIKEKDRASERGSTFSFKFQNIDDKKAEEYFWKKFGITVVGGSHWNLAHDFYSEPSMLRATFLHYNTREEVKQFLKAVKWISAV